MMIFRFERENEKQTQTGAQKSGERNCTGRLSQAEIYNVRADNGNDMRGIGVLMQIIKEDYYKSSCDRLEILRSQGTLF